MNRYLIVVFCVLTGCAATVPAANCQEFAIDQQLFAEWCANHVTNFDETYSSPILVHVKQDKFSGKYIQNSDDVSLLQNLPKFPPSNQNCDIESTPVSENIQFFTYAPEVVIATVPDGDYCVRAPVVV